MERELLKRLALACANGAAQERTIKELLKGPIYWSYKPLFGSKSVMEYGPYRLSGASYESIHKRLTKNGFVLKKNQNDRTITLTFPELGINYG